MTGLVDWALRTDLDQDIRTIGKKLTIHKRHYTDPVKSVKTYGTSVVICLLSVHKSVCFFSRQWKRVLLPVYSKALTSPSIIAVSMYIQLTFGFIKKLCGIFNPYLRFFLFVCFLISRCINHIYLIKTIEISFFFNFKNHHNYMSMFALY